MLKLRKASVTAIKIPIFWGVVDTEKKLVSNNISFVEKKVLYLLLV